MCVIEWNEIWEFRVLQGCGKNLGFFQNCMHRLAAHELLLGNSC